MIFEWTKKIATYAFNNIPFYKNLYNKNGFNPETLKTFDDIKSIPIVTKSMFLEYELEQRSRPGTQSMLINTGGSSGKTLSLYIPPVKLALEWAHMHYLWNKQMNFKPSDLKLLLVGRSNVRNAVSYDFVRNSLRIDIYKPFSEISRRIVSSFPNCPIYFIHGYPSSIYELALYCRNEDIALLNKIKNQLKGCILCSEYPDEFKRQQINEIFGVKSHAFYGHAEGCVLAYRELS